MNKENRLVSICIPAYNHEKFVQEAIKSIIDQTYENIELLIINDGSPDKTHEKIMELYDKCKERFKRFEYINRENRGLIATLKEFEQLAKGYYFSVMYSDDFCDKTRVQKQVDALNQDQESALCYADMMVVDDNSKHMRMYKTKYNDSGYVFDKLIFRNFIAAPTVMVRKSALDEVGGYDTRYRLDDHPLWLKISKKYKILYLNEVLVYYRDHDNNLSKNVKFMIEENEKMLNDWFADPMYQKAIERHYLYCFIQLVKANNKELAKEYMLKAFRASWYHPKFIKGVARYLFK